MHEPHDLVVVVRLELHGLGIHVDRAGVEGILVGGVPVAVLYDHLNVGGQGEAAVRQIVTLEGIADLIGTIKLCNKNLNPKLHLEGILLTMYDSRTNLTKQVAWEVKKYFEDRIFETAIPRSIKLAEAPSFGKPGIIYDKWNRGSRAYMKLADEFIHRQSLPEE